MKLLGILKEKFEKAETIEEKKKVLAEVGVELTDDEFEGVTGGTPLGQAYLSDISPTFMPEFIDTPTTPSSIPHIEKWRK